MPTSVLLNLTAAMAMLALPCLSFSLSSASISRELRHNGIINEIRHRPWPSPAEVPSTPRCMFINSSKKYKSSKSHLCMSIDSHSNNDNGNNTLVNVQNAIDKFISTLQASLDDGSFESFTLKGPSAPRKRRKKKKGDTSDVDAEATALMLLEQQKERLRGKYKTISGRLVLLQEKKKRKKRNSSGGKERIDEDTSADAAAGTLYLQTTIKYHLATDVAKNWKVEDDRKQPNTSEQTEVEAGLKQLFLVAMGEGSEAGDSTDIPLSEWGAQNLINGELGILAGELVTSKGIHKLQLQPHHKASFRLSKKNTSQKDANKEGSQLQLSHDRSKNVPLSPSSQFFQKLGVTNENGKPVNGMASKLRQCQKFVEIVGNLVDNSKNTNNDESPSRIRVVDMGCGRGYLTFSLHSYLSNKLGPIQDGTISVETQGIDRRPKLIEEINGIAQDLGGVFSTLNFIEGTIGETQDLFGGGKLTYKQHAEQGTSPTNSMDILIALHACDTATDDALWFGIARDVDIIVLAPCCQHELRPQIDHHTSSNPNHPLSDILRHAIYRERATETVTDAMRAILLEIAGYNTQVFEFIGGEHTAKNVMITATKVKRRLSRKEHDEWLQDRRRRLVDLAQLYGVKRQRLATVMGETILSSEADDDIETVKRNLSGMAPL